MSPPSGQSKGREAGGVSAPSTPWQRCSCGLFFQHPLPRGCCPKCGKPAPPSAAGLTNMRQTPLTPPIAPAENRRNSFPLRLRRMMAKSKAWAVLCVTIGILLTGLLCALLSSGGKPPGLLSKAAFPKETTTAPLAKAALGQTTDTQNIHTTAPASDTGNQSHISAPTSTVTGQEKSKRNQDETLELLALTALGVALHLQQDLKSSSEGHIDWAERWSEITPELFNTLMERAAKELGAGNQDDTKGLLSLRPTKREKRTGPKGENLLQIWYGSLDSRCRVRLGFLESNDQYLLLYAWIGDREFTPSGARNKPNTSQPNNSEKDNNPQPDKKRLELPKGARTLRANVDTVGKEDMPMRMWIDYCNQRLSDVHAHATASDLILDFDVDTKSWNKVPVPDCFPLLVRVFDADGQYLTHFRSAEVFTANQKLFDHLNPIYERLMKVNPTADYPKPVLLLPTADRFVYKVNRRDLRDAAIVEIGFTERQ
jgi:hypothetical protein